MTKVFSMLPQRIVAIGASTVFGRVDPEGGGFIGRLKTWHESNHRKNCIFNLGISSETSTDFLKRLLPECTPRKPDLILLSAASNDARHVESKDAPCETPILKYEENISELIRQGKTLAPVIVLTGHPINEAHTTPLPYKNNYYFLKDLKRYMESAKRTCTEKQIPCLDVFSEWLKIDYFPFLYDDGLHPNAEGHQKIFELLRDFLVKLYP